MSATTMDQTATVKTGWVHGDNDTPCEHPAECGKVRPVYHFGGRPNFGSADD
jgi:hypothetical protein